MKDIHTIYFIGIKGVGMSALALVAKGMGYRVLGSDTDEEFITDGPLCEAGITVHESFSSEHISSEFDLVVVGAAYGTDNPELIAAKQRNIPCWYYSELLGYLSRTKKTIAVSGTHGKTTTTSLLAYLLDKAGLKPSYVIGTGSVAGLPSHGLAGSGEYFITEADDYKRAANDTTPKFLDLSPHGAIITSIEHDHPDLYPTLRDCVDAFFQFVLRINPKGFLVINGDDPQIRKLRARLADRNFISYGFEETNDYKIKMVRTKTSDPLQFRIIHKGESHGPFTMQLRGKHNVYNASSSIVMAMQLGVDTKTIKKILPSFQSVERRYQFLGEKNGVTVYDDYAHHPTSIQLTLEALKKQFPHKVIWCVFQPHTYSRTKALLEQFAQAFAHAKQVVITDIFGSAREVEATVTSSELVDAMHRYHKNVTYVPKDKLPEFLQSHVKKGDVVITMGAGDIYKIGRQFISNETKHD